MHAIVSHETLLVIGLLMVLGPIIIYQIEHGADGEADLIGWLMSKTPIELALIESIMISGAFFLGAALAVPQL